MPLQCEIHGEDPVRPESGGTGSDGPHGACADPRVCAAVSALHQQDETHGCLMRELHEHSRQGLSLVQAVCTVT